MDGVQGLIVTPARSAAGEPQPAPRACPRRLLVLYPRRVGHRRGDLMAGFGGFKVISVDYRMPPEAYLPGGARRRDDGLEGGDRRRRPEEHGDLRLLGRRRADARDGAAREAGRPAAAGRDRAGHADVGPDRRRRLFQTNAMVDNVLVSRDGALRRARRALRRRPRPQGPAALAGVRRHARLPADDPHHRHARPAAQQHGARAPQAAPGRRRGGCRCSRASRTRSTTATSVPEAGRPSTRSRSSSTGTSEVARSREADVVGGDAGDGRRHGARSGPGPSKVGGAGPATVGARECDKGSGVGVAPRAVSCEARGRLRRREGRA